MRRIYPRTPLSHVLMSYTTVEEIRYTAPDFLRGMFVKILLLS
jgi:hypothetical protein